MPEGKDKRVCPNFQPSPKEEWDLISQGAEARVWKLTAIISTSENSDIPNVPSESTTNANVICKERFSKTYRHPDLDDRLTKSRCRSEAKLLEKCAKKSSIRVPRVLNLSPPNLYLEYLDGTSVKSHLEQNRSNDVQSKSKSKIDFPSQTDLARKIGSMIGRLHKIGIVHGDLTTSNMILLQHACRSSSSLKDKNEFDIALIDFGLSKSSASIEEQAVDLYVLERALQSTHPDLALNFFDLILDAYQTETTQETSATPDVSNELGTKKRKNNSQSTLQRLEQVRMRGRKRECFG